MAAPQDRAAGPPRAFDGDTLSLGDRRILRLAGVDAPESGRPFAEQARAVAQTALELAAPSESVVLQDGQDRYGRLLGDVGQGDAALSRRLLGRGLAWTLEPGDPEALSLQAQAVRAGRGLHGLDRPSAGPYLVSRERFHAPDCRTVAHRRRELPWSALAGPLFSRGLAPCRTCLRWPPVAPLASGPRDPGPDGR